jgi:thymidylate synthase
MSNFERQYLGTLGQILDYGVDRGDRTSVGSSRAIWGTQIEIDLEEGFPIPTTRKSAIRIAFEETWFFLRGEVDTKKLEAKKINIWKGNTTREFLDSRGLHYLPEGHLGKGYGFQWRNFGGDFHKELDEASFREVTDYYRRDNKGVDQLVELWKGLKNDPNGRRHIILGWNPAQLHEMALPPCHLYQQYQILDGRLNSEFMMRSWDFLYGAPFNIMGYALLNHAFAKALGLRPGKLVAHGNDVHLYANQLEIAQEQSQRLPYKLPTLTITKELNSLGDILDLEYTDFKLEGYNAHPDFKNKPGMAV